MIFEEKALYLGLKKTPLSLYKISSADIFALDLKNSYYPSPIEDFFGNYLNAFNNFLLQGNAFYLNERILTSRKSLKTKVSKTKIPETITSETFFERSYIEQKIKNFIQQKNSGYLFISGPLGGGKSKELSKLALTDSEVLYYKITSETSIEEVANFLIEKSDKALVYESSKNTQLIGYSLPNAKKKVFIFDDLVNFSEPQTLLALFPESLPTNIYIVFTIPSIENLILTKKLQILDHFLVPSLTLVEIKNFLVKNRIKDKKNNPDLINEILDYSNGIPLYVKIYLSDLFKFDSEIISGHKIALKKHFNSLKNKVSESDYNSLKAFWALLVANPEGFNKNDFYDLLKEVPEDLINNFLQIFSEFILKINGKYRLASIFVSEFVEKSYLSKNELTKAHTKIIDFYEPWDKKISSSVLKYLPTHYLKADLPEEFKELLSTNFVKSKAKIYPFELLDDVKNLIIYLIAKDPKQIGEITRYVLIHQKLKEESKRELLKTQDYIKSGSINRAKRLVEFISKPTEKFYQLLLMVAFNPDPDLIQYNKAMIKNIFSLSENSLNEKNTELFFRICSDLANEGLMDIISLPRNRDEGIILIKKIKESPSSNKLIELIIKLIQTLPTEIDRGVMLEQLILKIVEFKNITFVEKFLQDVLVIIDTILNNNLRDKLYYSYISVVIRFPFLYAKILPLLLARKEKISTNLFSFMYYANLSLIFFYLRQDSMSRDYILEAFNFIKKESPGEYREFIYSSMMSGIRFFSSSFFYLELAEKTLALMKEVFSGKKLFDKKLEWLSIFGDIEPNKTFIKELIQEFVSFSPEENNGNNLLQIVGFLKKVKDKRIKNPLIKKLLKYSDTHNEEFKISLYTILLLNLDPQEEYFEAISKYFSLGEELSEKERKVEIILDNIKRTDEKEYSEKLIHLIIKYLYDLNDQGVIYILAARILETINVRSFLTQPKETVDKLFSFTKIFNQSIYNLKLSNLIIVILMNLNENKAALSLLNKLFGILFHETNDNMQDIVSYSLRCVEKINDANNRNQYLGDLITYIFRLLGKVKKEDVIVKIVSDLFNFTSNLDLFPELKSLFYKSLEVADKIEMPELKYKLINEIRMYLPKLNEKNYLLDILQKSVFIAEKSNFPAKLFTLTNIAYMNDKFEADNTAKRLFLYVLAELRFFNNPEYIADVICNLSDALTLIKDKDTSFMIFDLLLRHPGIVASEKLQVKVYNNIFQNLIKIGDVELFFPFMSQIIDKTSDFKQEGYKAEYLIKLISTITNLGNAEKAKLLIKKLLEFRHQLQNPQTKINLYKSFIVSLSKLGNQEIADFVKELENDLDTIKEPEYKTELLSVMATSYYRTGNIKSGEAFFKDSIKFSKLIKDKNILFEILSNLALRLLSAGNINEAKEITDRLCDIFEEVVNEEYRFSLFNKLYLKFSQLRTIKRFREMVFGLFQFFTEFDEPSKTLKSFNSLIQAYSQYNEEEYKNFYIENSFELIEKKGYDNETIEATSDVAITLLKLGYKDRSVYLLSKVIDLLKAKKIKNSNELIVKIFRSLSSMGEAQNDALILKEVISLIDSLDFADLNDTDLHNLGVSFAYKNKTESFVLVYQLIKNTTFKQNLLKEVINVYFNREDKDSLLYILPFVLDDPTNTDWLNACLVKLSEDPKELDKMSQIYIY